MVSRLAYLAELCDRSRLSLASPALDSDDSHSDFRLSAVGAPIGEQREPTVPSNLAIGALVLVGGLDDLRDGNVSEAGIDVAGGYRIPELHERLWPAERAASLSLQLPATPR